MNRRKEILKDTIVHVHSFDGVEYINEEYTNIIAYGFLNGPGVFQVSHLNSDGEIISVYYPLQRLIRTVVSVRELP